MYEVPTVTVDDVPSDLHETLVVDVREDDEWRAGHVEGSVHIPLGQLVQRVTELPRDREVLVICRSGNRSGQAVAWLNENGYETVNVAGGVGAWQSAGRPLVDAQGEPGRVV
ncbi:rhodanese-like domain-containing protein [Thalassiella azotivora]